jgi:hypothetical protein
MGYLWAKCAVKWADGGHLMILKGKVVLWSICGLFCGLFVGFFNKLILFDLNY